MNMFIAVSTHREFFSKSYQIKPKSDCIYHFPIDFLFAVPNQSENDEYNLISVSFNKISKIFLCCVYNVIDTAVYAKYFSSTAIWKQCWCGWKSSHIEIEIYIYIRIQFKEIGFQINFK